MELKLNVISRLSLAPSVLIVPSGIETVAIKAISVDQRVLIVPSGIETK